MALADSGSHTNHLKADASAHAAIILLEAAMLRRMGEWTMDGFVTRTSAVLGPGFRLLHDPKMKRTCLGVRSRVQCRHALAVSKHHSQICIEASSILYQHFWLPTVLDPSTCTLAHMHVHTQLRTGTGCARI